MIREQLDDECRDCGKAKAEAEQIGPVTRGKYSLGPDWFCGECLSQMGGAA